MAIRNFSKSVRTRFCVDIAYEGEFIETVNVLHTASLDTFGEEHKVTKILGEALDKLLMISQIREEQ